MLTELKKKLGENYEISEVYFVLFNMIRQPMVNNKQN